MTRLEIISDPVCPWCYIGAHNLGRALAESGARPFELIWRPYQLNPDMPAEGMDRRAYLDAKFGGRDRADAAYSRVETAASEAGLEIDFSAIARAPNTLDSHRLIRWAAAEGVQTRAAMELFRRYFVLGEDISDHHVLAEAAGEAGLEAAVIARLLAGDADREVVRAEVGVAQAMGVTGVPTFVLGRKYALAGAQPVETWIKLIGELEAATAT